MKKCILLIILCLLFMPNVKAGSICSNKLLSELKDLAQNITYTYDYDTEKKSFNVTFTNVDKKLYLYNSTKNEKYPTTGEQMTMPYFAPGVNYKINVYTSNIRCIDRNLYTIYINLPYYNIYHNDVLCVGLDKFEYCQKFLPYKLSRQEFLKGIDEYNEKIMEQEQQANKKESILDKLLKVDKRIYVGAIILIIALGFVYRYFYNKKHDLF